MGTKRKENSTVNIPNGKMDKELTKLYDDALEIQPRGVTGLELCRKALKIGFEQILKENESKS